MEAKGISFFLSFQSTHEHSNKNLQFYILYGYSLFLSTAHVIVQNFPSNIYQALKISIKLNVNFTLLVVFLSDIITVIFHREVVYLNSDQLFSFNCKQKVNPISQPLPWHPYWWPRIKEN